MNRRSAPAAVLAVAGALGLGLASLPPALASTGLVATPTAICTVPNDPTGLTCSSASPTASPSAASSGSPSPSATTSASPSASASPSTSASPTASAAPSASASPSASAAPSASASCAVPGDPTGLSCASASPSATASPSASASPSQSASPAPSSASAPAAQATTIEWVGDDRIGYGDAVFAAAALTSADGRPLAGRALAFTVGHRSASATTDSDGLAYVVVPATTATRTIAALVRYDGDSAHQASSTRVGLRVLARSTGLRAAESHRRAAWTERLVALVGASYSHGAYGTDERSGITTLGRARLRVTLGGRVHTYACDAAGRLVLRGLRRGEVVVVGYAGSTDRYTASRLRFVVGRGGARVLPRPTGR